MNVQGSLAGLVRRLAAALAAGEETLEAANAANAEQFERVCHALDLSPTDATALLCKPPQVTLASARIGASIRLTVAKTRETALALRIAGRLVDSFYQNRFGTEQTTYQKLTLDVEKVATLDDVIVTDPGERENVRSLLRAFTARHQPPGGEDAEASVKQARRFARRPAFGRLLIVRSAEGWTCLLPPTRRGKDAWSSLSLARSGEVQSPAPQGARVSLAGASPAQRFAAALTDTVVSEDS